MSTVEICVDSEFRIHRAPHCHKNYPFGFFMLFLISGFFPHVQDLGGKARKHFFHFCSVCWAVTKRPCHQPSTNFDNKIWLCFCFYISFFVSLKWRTPNSGQVRNTDILPNHRSRYPQFPAGGVGVCALPHITFHFLQYQVGTFLAFTVLLLEQECNEQASSLYNRH